MSKTLRAWIRKATNVVGETLIFCDTTVADSAFLLSLRTDPERNRYLSGESADQAHFIIECRGEASGRCACVANKLGFFSGGVDAVKHATKPCCHGGGIPVYIYAADHLGLPRCHFDVRKGNEKVWRFHESFGAARQCKAKMDLLNSIGDTEIGATRWRYRKYLPEILAEVFCYEDK